MVFFHSEQQFLQLIRQVQIRQPFMLLLFHLLVVIKDRSGFEGGPEVGVLTAD